MLKRYSLYIMSLKIFTKQPHKWTMIFQVSLKWFDIECRGGYRNQRRGRGEKLHRDKTLYSVGVKAAKKGGHGPPPWIHSWNVCQILNMYCATFCFKVLIPDHCFLCKFFFIVLHTLLRVNLLTLSNSASSL